MSERDALTSGRSPTLISRLLMTLHGRAAAERRGDSDPCDFELSGLELSGLELNDLELSPRARLHAVNRS